MELKEVYDNSKYLEMVHVFEPNDLDSLNGAVILLTTLLVEFEQKPIPEDKPFGYNDSKKLAVNILDDLIRLLQLHNKDFINAFKKWNMNN